MPKTRQWKLKQKPEGEVTEERLVDIFELCEGDTPPLENGKVLLKVVALSNDPSQRLWIDPSMTPERLYRPPVPLGDVMHSVGLAQVVESRSAQLVEGDWVTTFPGWTEFAVIDATACQIAKDLPNGLSKTLHTGMLGVSGYTGFFGLTEVCKATKDDIVIVSGASGMVGSTVVQVAKKVIGCRRVVAIAGGAEKCRWVEHLGADVCLDYKSHGFQDDLYKETRGPLAPTVYTDYVSGDILDLVIPRLANHARVCVTGGMSTYNTSTPFKGPQSWYDIVKLRLNINGFSVFDFAPKFEQASALLLKAIVEGKLDVGDVETKVHAPFEQIPNVWLRQYNGGKKGKLITWIV